jgi:PAS domain S-box-containing protein
LKIIPDLISSNFCDYFFIKRPQVELEKFESLLSIVNQLVLIEIKNKNNTILRGQLETLSTNNSLIFIGSLWVENMNSFVENNLTLSDFPLHDPLIDLLNQINANEIANGDLRELLTKVIEQKKELALANQTLLNQRKFYEEILNNIPADIAVFDSNHHYLFINPNAIKNNELRSWMIGKKDEDYAMLRQKPYSVYDQRRLTFNEAKQSKQLKSFEEKIVKPDSTEQWIIRNFYPVLDGENEVEYMIGYGMDVTSFRKIEREIQIKELRYRDLFDNSLAIITSHNLEGRILDINPMVEKIYGYNQAETIGKNIVEFVPDEDKPIFSYYISEILQKKQVSGVIRFTHKTGKIIYGFYNNYLREEEGKEPYVIGFAVDITDRVKAEKQLEIAIKKSEELAKVKQSFLANMSHEIRTPMNIIVGMSNLLNKTHLNKKQVYYLNILQSTSDHLLKILNDILDLSKIESGNLTLQFENFSLRESIDRAIEVMNHRAEEKRILLSNSFFDDAIALILVGDHLRINQLLLNILSNAIKFTEKGSVDISCSLISSSSLKQTVEIKVIDTGIGMDQAFTEKIFQKFTQEDNSNVRKFGGTGLGMSICKEIVDLMSGNIVVKSSRGVGTSVIITLELLKGEQSSAIKTPTLQIDTSIIKNKKIIIADDNQMNRKLAGIIIKSYGATITEAENGEQVIKRMSRGNYDLIIMDIEMPVMNGVDATLIIRNKLNLSIPIIALTAFAFEEDKQKFIAAGMNGYLSKPFKEIDLAGMVSKFLFESMANEKSVNTNESSIKLFNLDKLRTISNNNKEFMREMIALFIQESNEAIEKIMDSQIQSEYATIRKIVHKIKPSVEVMGVASIAKEIKQIEETSEDNIDKNLFNQLTNTILTVLKEAINQIKSEILIQ